MATKRIGKSAIDWVTLSKRVPPEQKALFQQFKTKSDRYLNRVLANPEAPPAIDWAQYKNLVPVAGMVDDFQKQYTTVQIPYPPNTVAQKLDALEKEIKQDVATFKQQSDTRITEFQKELDHVKSLLPFDQMTMDDAYDLYPDQCLDPINRPTFWPHEPEDQPGYVPEVAEEEKKH